jgi:hypothetical protein
MYTIPKTPVQEVGKVQFEYQTPSQSQRTAKYSNSTFLAWAILDEYLQCLQVLAFVCIIIILSLTKLAVATGHAKFLMICSAGNIFRHGNWS